jgi:hypothetical protein
VKSPSEFMELSTEHARAQTQTLTEQTKALAELAQKIALAGAKPLQEGVAKAFNRACLTSAIRNLVLFEARASSQASSYRPRPSVRAARHVSEPAFRRGAAGIMRWWETIT